MTGKKDDMFLAIISDRDIPDEQRAINIDRMFDMGTIMRAQALYIVKRDRLYVKLGYDSFAEYYRSKNLGKTRAFMLCKIADRLLINPPTSSLSEPLDLESLGLHKLYTLARLDKDDLKSLFSGNGLKMNDGGVLEMEDILAMSSTETTNRLVERVSQQKTKNMRLTEEKNKLQSEKDLFQKRAEELEEERRRFIDLEREYGQKARNFEDKTALLAEARQYATRAFHLIVQADINPEDTKILWEELSTLIQSFNTWLNIATSNSLWLRDEIEDFRYFIDRNLHKSGRLEGPLVIPLQKRMGDLKMLIDAARANMESKARGGKKRLAEIMKKFHDEDLQLFQDDMPDSLIAEYENLKKEVDELLRQEGY